MNCCRPGKRASPAAMGSRSLSYGGGSTLPVMSGAPASWSKISLRRPAPGRRGRLLAGCQNHRSKAWCCRRSRDPAAGMCGGRAGGPARFGDPSARNAWLRTLQPAAIITFAGPGPSSKPLSAIGMVVRSRKLAGIAGASRDFAFCCAMGLRGSPASTAGSRWVTVHGTMTAPKASLVHYRWPLPPICQRWRNV